MDRTKIKLGDVVYIWEFGDKRVKSIVIELPYDIADEMYITCEVNGCGYIINTVGLDYNDETGEWFQITKKEALKRGLKVFER